MADSHKPGEADLLALIAQIHGDSPSEQRESHVEAALTTLEATHRAAARALRDIHTVGARRERSPLLPSDGAAAGGAQGPDVPVGQEPAPSQEPPSPPKAAQPNLTHAEGVTVQSGEGAEVDLGQRTLTHIVRPNRGRR